MTDGLRVEVDGPVATLTLDRPVALNALTVPVKVALREALESLAADPGVRAVILTGAGVVAPGSPVVPVSAVPPKTRRTTGLPKLSVAMMRRTWLAMMRTPDGHSKLELSKFQKPKAISAEPNIAVNTQGLHRIMFAVEDIEEVLSRLEAHGAKLIGELAQYEDKYRLCYVRGPEGIIVALAEQIH